MRSERAHILGTTLAFGVTVALALVSGRSYLAQRVPEPLHPSAALSRTMKLSELNPTLAGSGGDADVYVFEGAAPGASLLVLGGTHPNEFAAYVAAVVLLENLEVQAGTVYVIPRANPSASTHTEPQEANPRHVDIATGESSRRFRLGARVTNPVHQWPDPEIYLHASSGSVLAGNETRNLNRAFPGVRDGNLTERIAWAITELIRRERIDLAIDLHEAAPEYPVNRAIVASERSQDLASFAVVSLQLEGFDFLLEPSPAAFRGLSHREWTDFTDTHPFLVETPNPAQGRLRGRTDEELVRSGSDPLYARAARIADLSMPWTEGGYSLENRVARHLSAVAAIVDAYNLTAADGALVASGWPNAADLLARGVGAFLRPGSRSPAQSTS
jgi:hypothetical protein